MLWKGLRHDWPKPGGRALLPAPGVKAGEVQVVACQRPDKIRPALFERGMQRAGIGDMFFNEVILVVFDSNIQPFVGNQAALVEGILVGVPQRHEFIVLLEIGERQLRSPAHRFQGGIAPPLQLFDKRRKLAAFQGLCKTRLRAR